MVLIDARVAHREIPFETAFVGFQTLFRDSFIAATRSDREYARAQARAEIGMKDRPHAPRGSLLHGSYTATGIPAFYVYTVGTSCLLPVRPYQL
jgi:hypothetical protein